MFNLKILIPLASEFFKVFTNSRSVTTDVIAAWNNIIRKEILNLSSKIFYGLILSTVIILSLSPLIKQIEIVLMRYEEGPFVIIFVFLLVIISCVYKLHTLFEEKANFNEIPAKNVSSNSNLGHIMNKFFEGFSEGSKKSCQETTENNQYKQNKERV